MIVSGGMPAFAQIRRVAVALAVSCCLLLAFAGTASAALSFSTAPALPVLPGVTLNGQSQATTTAMTNFAITETTAGVGWNLTVAGLSGGGKSAVFKQYCPNATCGTDSGPGYIAGGYTLPADSLMLNTTGATWTSGATKPTYTCNGVGLCYVDSAAATKVVSAPTNVTTGTLTTTGFSATSLSLSTPTTLHKLQAGEVYRVNVVWTLSAGP
jgi:hypothetical protein